jgi:fatty acid-binding protein DegV
MARVFAEDVSRFGLKEVVVHYIGERSNAEEFADSYVRPLATAPVAIVPVSPVIGVHVGPAVGIVYETERALQL